MDTPGSQCCGRTLGFQFHSYPATMPPRVPRDTVSVHHLDGSWEALPRPGCEPWEALDQPENVLHSRRRCTARIADGCIARSDCSTMDLALLCSPHSGMLSEHGLRSSFKRVGEHWCHFPLKVGRCSPVPCCSKASVETSGPRRHRMMFLQLDAAKHLIDDHVAKVRQAWSDLQQDAIARVDVSEGGRSRSEHGSSLMRKTFAQSHRSTRTLLIADHDKEPARATKCKADSVTFRMERGAAVEGSSRDDSTCL